MERQEWQQEYEATGDIVFIVRKETDECGAQGLPHL